MNKKTTLQVINRRIKELTFLSNGIELYGLSKFKIHLREFEIEKPFITNDDYYTEKMHEICVIAVRYFNKYGIKLENFFTSKRRGKTMIARAICIVLFKEQLKLSDGTIGKFFGKVRQVTFKTLVKHELMCRNKKKHIAFFNDLKKIRAMVKKIL